MPMFAPLWLRHVATHAFGRRGVAFIAPATDRKAEHVQVAVVHMFAAKIFQGATLARVMAAMCPLHDA